MHRRHVVLGALAAFFVKDVLAQGVGRIRGAALINGQPATPGMAVRAGDTVVTGAGSEIVFVAGGDAMLVRQNSSLALLEDGFRLVTGAVLGVFAPRQRKSLHTATATIGIRGTAVYVEAERTRTYVCTCYGETALEPADDPSARETVRPKARHEHPRYILARGAPRMVTPAPMLNHTEAEIELLQKLRP
jgi:hypothetical protein